MILSVETDRSLIRASAHSTRHAVASIVAPQAERTHTRAPVNVAFVLDRSGSMGGGEKIELARRAIDHALRLLRSDDRFSLVVYDSQIDVVTESALATAAACAQARARLAAIEPRGSTDLCGGWLAGCEQVARYLDSEGLGRCMLLTDGLANHGVTDREEIVGHARELRRRNVITSTFGVGADFDERLLQEMADAGTGHFYFIERAVQIPDLFASELGEALEVVVSGATLTVATPDGVNAEVLNKFPHVREPGRLVIQLGDLASRQDSSVVVRLEFPKGEEGASIAATFSLQSAGAKVVPGESVEQTWTFTSRAACQAQPRTVAVDEAVGEIDAARARAEAVELNRRGDFAAAGRVIANAARSIEVYAAQSPALRRTLTELQVAADDTSAPMSPMAMKSLHLSASASLRGRDFEGKARRKPAKE
jgi:Ca-activated chloride channel family protein